MTAQRLVESSRPTFRWEPSEAARDWQFIVLHHSATASGSVESIHREHGQRKDRYGNNWLGIGYHFVIGNGSGMEDGEISPTFRWKGQIHGAHSGSTTHNATGIGICVIGNFENHPPSERQLTALTELLIALSRNYNIPESRIIPHSVVRATACPGSKFPLKELLQRIKSES
ncbi:MAG: peptidoglycan recognition family protein [Planctomycetaceae bacterium]